MKKIVLLLFLTFGSLFAFEELTANNYEQKVNNKNVILDFYATW
jgi:thioredoxin 1